MSSPQSVTKNIVLGAGYIYFDPEDANGNLTGETYMAETPGFSLNIATEKLEIESSDTPVAETLVSITTKITRAGSLECRDISNNVLGWFIQGAQSTVSQTGTSVTDEAITVQQGRYYQLGASASNPAGVRNVSSVVIQDVTDTTTYTVTDDYVVNADEGRIYIVEGGAISDDDVLHIDYTVDTSSRVRVTSGGDGAQRGALRFVGDNTVGENRTVYMPQVELAANGDLAFKSRDTALSATFDLNILTRDGYQQVYVDGVAA
jgi:hypothetical protein